MNENTIEIFRSMFRDAENLYSTETELAVNCVCYDIDAVIIVIFDRLDEKIVLSVKSEDATAFEDCMRMNGFDLSDPEINYEIWSDVHELWINFNFVWVEDQEGFKTVVNGLLH